MFGSADYVGNGLYVFNIRGGNYRLIVRIIFRVRTIYIKFVGTHKQMTRLIWMTCNHPNKAATTVVKKM